MYTIYIIQYTLYTIHYTIYIMYTIYIIQYTLYTITLYSIYYSIVEKIGHRNINIGATLLLITIIM